MSADRTLRFVVSGEHAFGPIARWREPDVAPGGPSPAGGLRARLGLAA